MKDFRHLYVWQKSMELVEEIYIVASLLPREETYALASQMKRASTSIVANIAEGFGRYTFADKTARYVIARGECSELRAFLYVVLRLRFIDEERLSKAIQLSEETGRLLSGLISASRKQA